MSGEKYWVNLPVHNAGLIKNRSHSDILEISQMNNLINEIATIKKSYLIL